MKQQGIDVVIEIFDPGRRRLFKIDSPTGSHSDEQVFLLAGPSGSYRAEVRPFNPSSSPGVYLIQIAERRPATADDRLNATAERAFAEARELEERHSGTLFRPAVDLYRQAARLWQQVKNRPRQADALFRLARMHHAAGAYRMAVDLYLQALPLRSPEDLPQERARLLNDLGAAYCQLGEVAAGERSLQEAAALQRRAALPRGEAATLLNLGDLYRRQGRILEALEQFERAQAILRSLGYRQAEVTAANELGALYTALGETDQALEHHQRALRLLNPQQDQDLWVATLQLMGNAYLEAGDLESSARTYRQALDLGRRATNSRGNAVSWTGLGLIAERRGDSSQALDLYQRALRIFEEQGDQQAAGITLNNLGWLFARTDQPEKALGLYRQALERAHRLHDPALEMETLFGMGQAERQRGELATAARRIQTALGLVEAFRQRTVRSDLRTSYLASRQDYFSFFIDLLMEQHRYRPEAGYDSLALAVSEQSRARQLLDSLAEDRGELLRDIPPDLLARQKALGQALQSSEDRRLELLAQGAGPEALAPRERQRNEALAAYHQIEEKIRLASPWYASLSRPRPLAVQEIQRTVVDRDTILLEFHLGSPHSYLWLVEPNVLRSFVLPNRAALEDAARRAYKLLAESHQLTSAAAARRAVADLSWKLLGPVAPFLGSKRLVVVASGALQYIPFAALPEPSPEGLDLAAPPLIERHEIVHLPSASVLAILRQQKARRKPPPGLVAVVADPVLSRDDRRLRGTGSPREMRSAAWEAGLPRFARLPYSRQEAEAILSLTAGQRTGRFLGFEANRSLVLSGRLADFRILHFATHGWLDTEHPELSALLLSRFDAAGRSQNGRLSVHEIYQLDLPADLVVLSGCQTALGREIEGEGLVGLTRGFLYAGAERVVVSVWNVGDRSASELMTRFYRSLLNDGLLPAAALRQAQRSLLAEERWRAPSHWAGFVLQGDWN